MQITAKVNGSLVIGSEDESVVSALSNSFKKSVSGLIGGLKKLDNDNTEIKNYYANGSYVREMFIPKGTCVVGRVHKWECVNILLSGTIAIVDNDGNKKVMNAPSIFVSKPGHQKIGYALEDTRWLNTFACKESEIADAYDHFTCESEEDFNLLLEDKKL